MADDTQKIHTHVHTHTRRTAPDVCIVYAEDPAARQAAHCERDLTRILEPDKCKLADENVSLQKVLV